MNRNQKIALGCGGAGCLGLIVLVLAAAGFYFWQLRRQSSHASNQNYNSRVSSKEGTHSSSDNDDEGSDKSSNTNTSSAASKSALSEDDRHKLFHAATVSGDTDLLNRVCIKIGIMKEDFTPKDDYVSFVAAHFTWSVQNNDFIQSVNSPEKGREYVDKHLSQ